MEPSGGDIRVSALGHVNLEQSYKTFYDGLGGGWAWSGFGDPAYSNGTREENAVGTLTVDMFSSRDRKLIWRGFSIKAGATRPARK